MKFSKAGLATIAILSLVSLGSILLLLASGFRFFNITTPSMGETAPVGTLVITKNSGDYAKNDIISFYRQGAVYTHRIVALNEDGSYVTKGDLNAAHDSLPVKRDDVIGKAVVVAPILGWVWRALPMIAIGFVIVYLISCLKKVRDDWRWPVRIIGGSLVVIIVTFIVNPWLHVSMLSVSHGEKTEAIQLHVVNTGIFPIQDDSGNRIYSGQTANVSATISDEGNRYVYVPRPSLGIKGIILAFLWCIAPLIVALLVKLPPPTKEDGTPIIDSTSGLAAERRRNMMLLLVVIAVELVLLVIQLSSLAAFTARVTNPANSLASRTFFTCASTLNSTSNPRPYFTWYMNNSNSTFTDNSGNGRHGSVISPDTMPTMATTYSLGCVRDFPTSTVNFSRIANFTTASKQCVTYDSLITSPNTFTLEAWFNTSNTSNGRIIGFGSQRVANASGAPYASGNSDRHIYIDRNGRVAFGVYPGSVRVIGSPAGKNYADGRWHHVVATLSAAGMRLYLDGALVASDASVTSAQSYSGYWKVGCGQVDGWRNVGSTTNNYNGPKYFTGKLQFVSYYTTAMTDAQVRDHYLAGAP